MSRRQDDDLDELLTDLSGTLSELQDVLAEEEEDHPNQHQHQHQHHRRHRQHRSRRRRLPSPSRFLRFTEEYTIPTLISLLETNIRALELFQGLLRLINGRDERSDSKPLGTNQRVRRTGRRTLDALDGALSDLQGALDGEPTDSEARTLLDDARSLREEIDTRLAGDDSEREHDGTHDRTHNPQDDAAVTIDVQERERERDDGDETDKSTSNEVDVDDELDTIKRELRDDDDQGQGQE